MMSLMEKKGYCNKSKSHASIITSLIILLLSFHGTVNTISENKTDFPPQRSLTNASSLGLNRSGQRLSRLPINAKSRLESKQWNGQNLLGDNVINKRVDYNSSNGINKNSKMKCTDTTHRDDGRVYCNMSFDGLSCWPTTLGSHYAIISCPDDMTGVDSTKNASRFCNANGYWEERADYLSCIKSENTSVYHQSEHNEMITYATRVIYNVGFGISTVALVIALFIFLYFRSLKCLRNRIHSHLIVTFILSNTVWFIMQSTLEPIVNSDFKWLCKVETVLFNYAMSTNFFWMLVEGLYLHIIIVWTYSSDKIKLWYFLIIGWVIPGVVIIVWSAMRAHFDVPITDTNHLLYCWLPSDNTSESHLDDLDYIYIAPTLFVLAVNMLFLASIIWVLVTKLRASHTMESRQLRKAGKATLLLFPLLGITYLIFLWAPDYPPAIVEAHKLVNAFLQSFQGFFVALFYCFLNGEVKGVLKKKFNMMQDSRNLSTRYTKTSIGWANDISRKESVALSNGRWALGYYDNGNGGGMDRTPESDRGETENML